MITFTKESKVKAGEVIVMAVPFFINTTNILEVIKKNEKLSNAFYIRFVVTKININNFNKGNNSNLVKNVITYAVEGYS